MRDRPGSSTFVTKSHMQFLDSLGDPEQVKAPEVAETLIAEAAQYITSFDNFSHLMECHGAGQGRSGGSEAKEGAAAGTMSTNATSVQYGSTNVQTTALEVR